MRRYLPLISYAALAALIMGPLLLPGYVLTLDMVFVPQLTAPTYVSSSYVFYMLLHWLDIVLPSQLIQKVMLLAIFTLAGWGMHRFIVTTDVIYGKTKRLHSLTPYAAGIFYTINPFTYDRLMAGQFAVLFGYALLPWFCRALISFTHAPAWPSAIQLTAWAVAISIVSIHSVGLIAVVAGLTLAVAGWQKRHGHGTDLRRLSVWTLGIVAAWLAVSSYWLWPLLAGQGSTASTVQSFTSQDRLAFQTIGNNALERLGNVVGLQGFWAEGYKLVALPQSRLPGGVWELCCALLLFIVIIGGIVLWRRRRRGLLVTVAGTGLIGLVLAAGIGNTWLAAHVPFYAGYREPQKFAALLALAYAVLLAYGFDGLMRRAARLRQNGRLIMSLTVITVLLLPYLLTPTMPWAATGQLRAVQYPHGWAAVAARLQADQGARGKLMILPWHLYLRVDFARRVVANPGPRYFGDGWQVLSSTDAEIKGAAQSRPSGDTRQADGLIRAALAQPADSQAFGEGLNRLGVEYVILTKNTDFERYAFLDRQHNMQRIYDDEDISLYWVGHE